MSEVVSCALQFSELTPGAPGRGKASPVPFVLLVLRRPQGHPFSMACLWPALYAQLTRPIPTCISFINSEGFFSTWPQKEKGAVWLPSLHWSDRAFSALFNGRIGPFLGPGVVRAGADDLAVLALLDHVRAPAAGARDHEQRREHCGGHAHHVVRRRAVPVQVREHLLQFHHDALDPLRDLEQARIAALVAELARDILDDRIARIADRVDRMAEADHDFLVGHALADVLLRVVARAVERDDLHRDLVG